MIAKKYFKIQSKIDQNIYPNTYHGEDIEQGQSTLMIEVDASFSETDTHQKPLPELKNLIIGKNLFVDNKKRYVVAYLPSEISLHENIIMMKKLNQQFSDSEINRIGYSLIETTARAESNGLIALLHSECIFISLEGSINILAVDKDYISKNTVFQNTTTQELISNIVEQLTFITKSNDSPQLGKTTPKVSIQLKKLLNKFPEKNSHIKNFNIFVNDLKHYAKKNSSLNSLPRLGVYAGILLFAVIFFNFYKPKNISKLNLATRSEQFAAKDIKSNAHATAKEWQIYMTSKRLDAQPHSINANALLLKGDTYIKNSQLEQANAAYRQALILFESALVSGKEIVKLRTDSENARTLMRLSQSRWQPLLGSIYIDLPEQALKANEAALEGDFQQLKQRYKESIIAYQLAKQLYEMIPSDEFNKLLYRHQANDTRDRALLSENTWDKFAESIKLKSSAAVNQAKEQMANGQGLLKSKQFIAATHAFEEAAILFKTVVKESIENIQMKVRSTNAYERAVESAKQWQNYTRALKKTGLNEETTEAKATLEQAHQLAKEQKYNEATERYERAAALYELQTDILKVNVVNLAKSYQNRADQMIESLEQSQIGLKNRLNEIRLKFESIHTQIAQYKNPQENKKTLDESAKIRRKYQQISKLIIYCDTNVYNGVVNERAHALLKKGQELIIQGNYVAALLILENASNEFSYLANLPSTIENYFLKEEETLNAKDKIIKNIGPIASELSEVKKLFKFANKDLQTAKNLLSAREGKNAVRTLEYSRLAFNSIPAQAEVELLSHALSADSQMRKEVAIKSLNELLRLNPAHVKARKLITKIQSSKMIKERISIIQGQIRHNGKLIPSSPSHEALITILGKPSRTRSGNTNFIFDKLGILATPDPETKKIFSIIVYYAQPNYENEPQNFYPGFIEIEGVPIERDAQIENINKTLDTFKFKKTRVSHAFEAQSKGLRILINYKKGTHQIYSISFLYIDS